MSLHSDIEALRRHLKDLAFMADTRLPRRFALWHPPGEQPTLYRRVRRQLGDILRRLHLRPSPVFEPWLAGLKHAKFDDASRPLLIWAVGADADQLRASCRGLQKVLDSTARWAPVLVTDVADFAFYSRLGWLVEFVPTLSEPGGDFGQRKQRYLAWRYRHAPALPIAVGRVPGVRPEDLLLG
jgi:hypothetical protein